MSLEKFMKLNKLSYRKFASVLGIDHSALYRYTKRKATPSLRIAVRINEATEGKVSMSSLLCN